MKATSTSNSMKPSFQRWKKSGCKTSLGRSMTSYAFGQLSLPQTPRLRRGCHRLRQRISRLRPFDTGSSTRQRCKWSSHTNSTTCTPGTQSTNATCLCLLAKKKMHPINASMASQKAFVTWLASCAGAMPANFARVRLDDAMHLVASLIHEITNGFQAPCMHLHWCLWAIATPASISASHSCPKRMIRHATATAWTPTPCSACNG